MSTFFRERPVTFDRRTLSLITTGPTLKFVNIIFKLPATGCGEWFFNVDGTPIFHVETLGDPPFGSGKDSPFIFV